MPVFTNARIVLSDEVIHGHLAVDGSKIESVGEGSATGEDLEGDYLLPGLVELHTDHLETHVAPRPRVRWNYTAAAQAHDAQMTSSGITTVFDALRVGSAADDDLDAQEARDIAEAIVRAQAEGRLRADHKFHLRCEVSNNRALPDYALFDDLEGVHLISLMDHTPGQRQFRSIDVYRAYYQRKNGLTDEEFEVFQAEKKAQADAWSDKNRRALSQLAHARGIVVASHDDATVEHVDEAVRDGVTLAEFPTTLEAADASRTAGMVVLMGGPNLVRGGSHSGNVSVAELADRGALDILSSDYVPFSLMQSAFLLSEREGWTLPRAISTVTSAPAKVVKLSDRGSLAPGLRADFVRVRRPEPGTIPVVRGVWREGVRVG